MTKQLKAYPHRGQMVKGYCYRCLIRFNDSGWLSQGQFPVDCIRDCSASGQRDEAVEYWRKKLGFVAAIEPRRELAERYLEEFGAWDDLQTADIEVLADRILWTACCDIAEQGEWAGLVH